MLAHIHIGLSKTGTSSLQTFLFCNRQLLFSRQGALYPISVFNPARGYPNHNPLAVGAYTHALPLLRAELQSCDPPPQRLILSAEMLSLALRDPAQVRGFVHFLAQLGATQQRIVIYLRSLPERLTSICSQAVMNGFTIAYPELHPSANPHAQASFDIRAILERWIAVCGRENIKVRLFEPQSWVNGDLLHDAADALDLRWDEDFVIPPRQNERLNLLEMEVLRALNRLVPHGVYDKNTLKSHIFQHLSRHTSKLKGEQLRFAVPKATLEAYLDCFAESEEWVRREFFPERPYLFDRPDLSAYAENPILRNPRPEHWQALARTLIDLGQENARLRAELRQMQRQKPGAGVR